MKRVISSDSIIAVPLHVWAVTKFVTYLIPLSFTIAWPSFLANCWLTLNQYKPGVICGAHIRSGSQTWLRPEWRIFWSLATIPNSIYSDNRFKIICNSSLGRNQNSAAAAIDYLMQTEWVDPYTRAIFLEFTLYNNQLNIYTISFIKFELLQSGG